MDESSKQADAWKTAEPGSDHPAGEIRVTPKRLAGARFAALGGMAIGALAAATPIFQHVGTTSGP